jgi:hypothetical protein
MASRACNVSGSRPIASTSSTTKDIPGDHKMALLELEDVPDAAALSSDHQQIAIVLSLPEAEVPAVRLTRCHLRRDP